MLVEVRTDPRIGSQRGALLRLSFDRGFTIGSIPDGILACRLVGPGAAGVLGPAYGANEGIGLGEGAGSELHLLRCT